MTFTKGGLYAELLLQQLQDGGALYASANSDVSVYTDDTEATAVTVYSDEDLSTELEQPFETDGQGNISFYAPPGIYWLKVVQANGAEGGEWIQVDPHPSEVASDQDVEDAVDGVGGGSGVPDGGTTNQVLTKLSNSDGDADWADPTPGEGAVGSVNGQTGDVTITAEGLGAELEGVAATLVAAHEGDTTDVHGIADTANLVYTDDSRLTDEREPTDHSHSFDNLPDTVMYIDEVTAGTWSADAPARAANESPKVIFTGLTSTSNPKDPTNGITTPDNILDTDLLIRPSS